MKEVADGIWKLGGFPPNAINAFLAGEVLVDCATRLAGRRFRRQLAGRKVSEIALTHVHPDHQGLARDLRERLGVPLACHEADADRMEAGPTQPANPRHPLNRLIDAFWAGPYSPVDRRLSEGDTVGDLRVVHLPGHTPGHICLFRDSDRVAICGDAINTMNLLTMVPGARRPPGTFTLDVEANTRSIRKLAELEPSLLLAGHGPPLDGAKLAKLVDRLP